MATSFSISAGTNRVRIIKISANGRTIQHIEPRCPGSVSIEAGDVLRIRELPNTGTERRQPHQAEALPNSTTGGQGFPDDPPPMRIEPASSKARRRRRSPECTCGGGPDDLHGIGCPARAFVGVGAAAREGQRLAHQAAVRSLEKEPLPKPGEGHIIQEDAGHPMAPHVDPL